MSHANSFLPGFHTGQSILRIPVDDARSVRLRYSRLPRSTQFDPKTWPHVEPTDVCNGCVQFDLAALALPDGAYEYEFVIVRPDPKNLDTDLELAIPDPWTPELTKYGGYRGVFHMAGGQRIQPAFDWSGEPDLRTLPGNHQLLIYELPMRWVDDAEEGYARQVGLGTFDKARHEHLDAWKRLGINAIELTPVQDAPDSLNWGYGTRFFFAPDFDMGGPYELKMFILECHRRGIRVILDVVMNHSRGCPLQQLAFDRFYVRDPDDAAKRGYFLGELDANERKERPDWGGQVFRYAHAVDGVYWAREFQYAMARYWIEEYHIDGFRIDEFKGINNWDFIREFTRRAHDANNARFPDRPFLVVAEDSWRRAEAAGGNVVDAIWDFDFQDGLRRLVTNSWWTAWQKPPGGRRELVTELLRGNRVWNEGAKNWRDHGFGDIGRRIIYPTSHDVEGHHEQRLWGFLLEHAEQATGDHSVSGVVRDRAALEMQVAAFALTCTAIGMPMFLAGEEFAEAHDVPHGDWRLKMSDVVDWHRREQPGHRDVLARVSKLLELRRTAPCLQWNQLEFFGLPEGFDPSFNDDDGARVFAFCRPGNHAAGNQNPGKTEQAIVVANCASVTYAFDVAAGNATKQRRPALMLNWPWGELPVEEVGGMGQALPQYANGRAALALDPFQVRVFRS